MSLPNHIKLLLCNIFFFGQNSKRSVPKAMLGVLFTFRNVEICAMIPSTASFSHTLEMMVFPSDIFASFIIPAKKLGIAKDVSQRLMVAFAVVLEMS